MLYIKKEEHFFLPPICFIQNTKQKLMKMPLPLGRGRDARIPTSHEFWNDVETSTSRSQAVHTTQDKCTKTAQNVHLLPDEVALEAPSTPPVLQPSHYREHSMLNSERANATSKSIHHCMHRQQAPRVIWLKLAWGCGCGSSILRTVFLLLFAYTMLYH